jgi:hypothetical protein
MQTILLFVGLAIATDFLPGAIVLLIADADLMTTWHREWPYPTSNMGAKRALLGMGWNCQRQQDQ